LQKAVTAGNLSVTEVSIWRMSEYGRRTMNFQTAGVLAATAFVAGLAAPISATASGAVVIAPDRSVVFWSVNQPSVGIAVENALGSCRAQFGPGCTVFKTFDSGCLAVARPPSHMHWGVAIRDNPHDARFEAIGTCAKFAPNCHTQIVNCE
jgi:hypothetical protein